MSKLPGTSVDTEKLSKYTVWEALDPVWVARLHADSARSACESSRPLLADSSLTRRTAFGQERTFKIGSFRSFTGYFSNSLPVSIDTMSRAESRISSEGPLTWHVTINPSPIKNNCLAAKSGPPSQACGGLSQPQKHGMLSLTLPSCGRNGSDSNRRSLQNTGVPLSKEPLRTTHNARIRIRKSKRHIHFHAPARCHSCILDICMLPVHHPVWHANGLH